MTRIQSDPLRLYFVRHGQIGWSLTGQRTGTTELSRTAEGEEEGRALIPWLKHIQIDRVLCSSLQRAMHGNVAPWNAAPSMSKS
jgi:broad specificity phosphatase PhoE